MTRITRRRFLALCGLMLPGAMIADAWWLEPGCLEVRRLTLPALPGQPRVRLVHFTDFHYRGDAALGRKVVAAVNAAKPDFACFTGDLVEKEWALPAALDFIGQIRCPVYGVRGNHDVLGGLYDEAIVAAFAATGGRWLRDASASAANGTVGLCGLAEMDASRIRPLLAPRRILLMHWPAIVDAIRGFHFDLILAGHSHGGQVRLPFYGPLFLPYGVGRYDRGLFQTPAGPLYVSSGIGTYGYPLRFACRPEVVVVDL